MTALADAALDQLVEAILPRLVSRGFVLNPVGPTSTVTYADDYDDATCGHFLKPEHLGDGVLERIVASSSVSSTSEARSFARSRAAVGG